VADDDGTSGRTAGQRPEPVDREPGPRLGRTLMLLDEIDAAARRVRPVLRTVEHLTGLSPAQLTVLMAVDGDEPRPVDIGAATTAVALADRGLLRAAGWPLAAAGGGWQLTDDGQAVLQQVQGLRVRIVDTVTGALDDAHLDEIRASLRRVAAAVDDLYARTGESAHAAIPRVPRQGVS